MVAALSQFADIKIHSNYDTGMNKMKRNMKITVRIHGDFSVPSGRCSGLSDPAGFVYAPVSLCCFAVTTSIVSHSSFVCSSIQSRQRSEKVNTR